MYDIIVIGGGAAGMMAAAAASARGARVAILERNDKPGKKLRITGKGRCNLTNDCAVSEVLANITTGGRFLQSSLNGFTPRDAMDFFESIGVPLKTERGGRVFPQSDEASTVADALWRHTKKNGVEYIRGRATKLIARDGHISGIATTDAEYICKSAILATGGASYPATGSTGDGYKMASELGHTITPLRASLVPLEAEPETCAEMQGLTLKNIRMAIYGGDARKPIFEDFGELLFTHFGISGPLPLSASAHMRDFEQIKYHAIIDLKPALDEKKLDLRILRDFDKYSNRDFANALGDLLSKTMIPVVIKKSGIDPGIKVHSINREQRLRLVRLLKSFRIDIDAPRPIDEAIITSGGVDTREINPKTMESKLIPGLYFAGEIINADAYTGGFNLQIAWSTATASARGTWNQLSSGGGFG